MIHLVARKTKAVTSKNLQQFILYVFARMQNASEISELEVIFFDFSVVLLSTSQNAEFKRSLDNLTNQIKGVKHNTDRVAETTVSYSEQDIKSSAETGPLYAKSPFYNIFQSLRVDAHEMVKKASSEGDPNPFYSPETVDMLMKSAMPYTPLWSGLILKVHNITRDTNCHAEIWMAILKRDILGGKTKQTPVKVMTSLRRSLKGRVQRRTIVNKKPNIKKKMLSKFPDVEEIWRKRSKAKRKKGILPSAC